MPGPSSAERHSAPPSPDDPTAATPPTQANRRARHRTRPDSSLAAVSTPRVVRVLVADDDDTVRSALADLVASESGLFLVGAAADAEQAVILAREHQPDVAVLDVRMPGGGERASREIRACSPGTRVVALSAHGDRRAVVGMVRSGATSYLVKGASAPQIIAAIRSAAAGDSSLSGDAATEIVSELGTQLDRRERELVDRETKLERTEQALTPGAIDIVYQPIFDLADGRRRGVEALARFGPEPVRTPDVWFDEAWEVGLGVELEVAAIRAALPALERLADDEFLAVNVSPDALLSPRLDEVLPPGSHAQVVLELTEHAKVRDYEALARRLEQPRRAGLRVASDDTGAGYSSLRHILQLAPEVIKLDMSLVRDVDVDGRRRALVAALIAFADQTDATTVAEGIETERELEALCSFGATWGQGYLLARPGRLEDAVDMTSLSPDMVEGTAT